MPPEFGFFARLASDPFCENVYPYSIDYAGSLVDILYLALVKSLELLHYLAINVNSLDDFNKSMRSFVH